MVGCEVPAPPVRCRAAERRPVEAGLGPVPYELEEPRVGGIGPIKVSRHSMKIPRSSNGYSISRTAKAITCECTGKPSRGSLSDSFSAAAR